MTAGLSAKLAASLVGDFTGVNDLSSLIQEINQQLSFDIQPGTGTGKSNEVFADTRNLAASTSENLDLSGVLKDGFGVTIAFTKIRAIIVSADKGNGALIKVGGAGSNTFIGPFGDATDIVNIAAGDFHILTSKVGWAVTASTADILKVANSDSGATADYSIILIGEA